MFINSRTQFHEKILFGVALAFAFALTSLPAVPAEKLTTDDVLAIDADPAYGEYLAGECMTCHTGKNTNASIPDINGREAAYIAAALLEYRDKTRENETMRSIASAMGPDEIAALAAYFSELSK